MPLVSGITTERTPIRSTPAGDEVIGSIPKDAAITAQDNSGQWLALVSVNGRAQGGFINARSVKIGTVTPPPPPPTDKRVTNIITVYNDGSISIVAT